MILMTRKQHLDQVINDWSNPNNHDSFWIDTAGIANAIKNLGDNPTEEQVRKVLGPYDHHCDFSCDECLQQVLVLIKFDQMPDEPDSPRYNLCQSCLMAAVDLCKIDIN